MLVSVLVHVYNEEDTVAIIVDRIRAAPYNTEIICVDDCSTDGTKAILARLLADYAVAEKGRGSLTHPYS